MDCAKGGGPLKAPALILLFIFPVQLSSSVRILSIPSQSEDDLIKFIDARETLLAQLHCKFSYDLASVGEDSPSSTRYTVVLF
jgi:hypothetical protein